MGLLLSDADKVDIRLELPESLEAPIHEGEIIGYIDVYINDEQYTRLNVYCKDTINRVNYKYYLDLTLERFLF